MAQARVIDYFGTKKRSSAANPSKKRKIQLAEPDLKSSSTTESTVVDDAKGVGPQVPVVTTAPEPAVRRSSARTKQKPTAPSTRTRASARKKPDLVGQPKILDAFAKPREASGDSDGQASDAGSVEFTDEITSQCDEHDGPKTPKRKTRPCETVRILGVGTSDTKRTHRKARRSLEDQSSATPNKAEEKRREEELASRRRSLAQSFQEKLIGGVQATPESEVSKDVPLPASLNEHQIVRKIEADKQKADHEKLEAVSAENPTAVVKPMTSASSTEKKPAPAYERYEHLAKEGPPSLSLPGKYQMLLNTFQGTDTVVSMLFNRQETITFSKLQAAVQSITKKNFEQNMLGQIKTVYPEAYNLRQERGLPSFGTKTSGYQLTVQPNLETVEKDGYAMNNDGKPYMSASAILKRKRIFHNTLINITKDHHADFLSKLSTPLKVPASKLTRWHPRFGLDVVPDIEPAELPEPPVKAYQTAKQVLEATRGKLPARVEEAMAKVAMKSESSQPTSVISVQESKSTTNTANKGTTSSAYKGIPLSLLEKIRAKEAARTQASLIRDPKEEKKTAMLGRLPTLIRSLRTFFVTEKKPSILMTTVVEKLADSYSTCISQADVEAHLKLLQELAPKWLQVIQIARGKYIKIDKNMEINQIIADVNNLAKSRK
ncbi:DNA replication factor Cdt1-like [Littorina saxatilis]|uniref:DNA replication factor Cdt1-like n=1 Tax=Littorina saxatilis TaxID=31220 RepID=UPI0038B48742